MRKSRILICIVLLAAGTAASSLHAQEQQSASRVKHEIGLWIGASNPLPGTELDAALDSNLGGGLFYRMTWPWIL